MNPWVILGIAVMWALSVVGASHKWASLKVKEAQAQHLEQRNKELAQANGEIKRLTDEARATERAHVEQIAAIGNHYAKGMRDAEELRKRDLRAARNGNLVLRVPASVCAGGSEAPATGPATGRGDGAAGVELPREITADLLELAHDADQVADQLRACQSVILSDRREQ